MLMKRRNSSPQERKIRDYTNQRTNAYGESKKNAYKAIRKRKRWVNRAYRKSVNNLLTQTQNETEEAEIGAIKRRQWRKCPDQLIPNTTKNRYYIIISYQIEKLPWAEYLS